MKKLILLLPLVVICFQRCLVTPVHRYSNPIIGFHKEKNECHITAGVDANLVGVNFVANASYALNSYLYAAGNLTYIAKNNGRKFGLFELNGWSSRMALNYYKNYPERKGFYVDFGLGGGYNNYHTITYFRGHLLTDTRFNAGEGFMQGAIGWNKDKRKFAFGFAYNEVFFSKDVPVYVNGSALEFGTYEHGTIKRLTIFSPNIQMRAGSGKVYCLLNCGLNIKRIRADFYDRYATGVVLSVGVGIKL